jgi:hypothetical protein
MIKPILTDLIKNDLRLFLIKIESDSAISIKLPGVFRLVSAMADLSDLYGRPGRNDLCQNSMEDADNLICQSAIGLLAFVVGDRKMAMKFTYEIEVAVSSHFEGIEFPPSCLDEFIVNYLANQAYAVSAHWHAEHTAKNKKWSTYLPKQYRRLVDMKYQAFKLGLVPVGTEVIEGEAKLLVWKPWCIK